jgi:hypothetical protein
VRDKINPSKITSKTDKIVGKATDTINYTSLIISAVLAITN